MSFIICKIQPLKNNRMSISRVRNLTLGGEKGLLARKLPTMSRSDVGNWSMTARDLLALENPEIQDDVCILFDLTPRESDEKNFFCLVDVCGRTMSLVTDAIFHFKVLTGIEVQAGGAAGLFTANNWQNGADRYEQMRLEGGFAGGNWGWTEPPLPLGATVLHPV